MMWSMKKKSQLIVALLSLCCAGAASAALTSRSYVRGGLVAQYDGIDNAGYGIHSDSTNRWVDLTGNGNDGTVNAAVTWDTKGWQNSNASIQPVTVGKGLAAAIAAAGRFSVQMTFTPTDNNRVYLFAQKDGTSNEFGIGRVDDASSAYTHNQIELYAVRPYWKRVYSDSPTSIRVSDGDWAAITFSMAAGTYPFYFTVHNGANPNSILSSISNKVTSTSSTAALSFSANATGLIGCDYDAKKAFCGTYNAFRLYNRDLTEDEIKLNAAIDAVRFNGGDPADYPILTNYTFDGEGKQCADFTAIAETGGKIRAGNGAYEASATVPTSDILAATFTAMPDAGYVFQEWTGDTSAITSGSILTTNITVNAISVGTVRAVFRKLGNALDGLVFDLDMQDVNNDGVIDASDKIGNAMKVSASDAADAYDKAWSTDATYGAHSPRFETMDVAAPMTPFTTNTQTCLYFPQSIVAGNTIFNSRVDLKKCGIMGNVSTFFVRFRWDGDAEVGNTRTCNINLLMNGCTGGWWNNARGYVLTIRTYTDKSSGGFLNVSGTQNRTGNWRNAITTNTWVDCFMSVYPSPTTPNLSNGDLYFCRTPTLSGGVFGKPELIHYHFGDSAAMTNLQASAGTSRQIWLGSARNDVQTGEEYRVGSFRGAIAAVKGWRRLLTENEMWCVMAGQYGGTFNVGVPDGKADEFGASGTETTFDPTAMAWQKMKKSLTSSDRTLTLSVPLPAENRSMPRLLTVKPLFDDVGASCPVTVTANGATVGTFDLINETECTILLRGRHAACDANGRLVISVGRPAGCMGTLSFDAISLTGSWQFGMADDKYAEMTAEAKGVTQYAVMGDPENRHVQRALTKVCPSLSLLFDVPENVDPRYSWTYATKFLSPQAGASQPLHLELNGETVWSSADVAAGTDIEVHFDVTQFRSGLNELKWCYDTSSPNWINMDYHKLRLVPPSLGTALMVR